jgi:hypothetical protein
MRAMRRDGRIPADLVTKAGQKVLYTSDQLARIIDHWSALSAPPRRERRRPTRAA